MTKRGLRDWGKLVLRIRRKRSKLKCMKQNTTNNLIILLAQATKVSFPFVGEFQDFSGFC